jgi:multiple sugar transport system substrate-binding protein
VVASAAPSSGIVLPTGPVTLRVAYYNAGGQTEIDYRQKQAEAFTAKYPNVTVKMEPVQDWAEVMYPQLAAGTAADVIWADTDTGYGAVAGKGAYQPLDPFIEKDRFDLSPWSVDIVNHFRNADGKLLLLPNSNLGFNFVYYNKQLFDEAAVPYPSNDWSIADMLATARQLTKPGNDQWGFGLAWNELYVTWMEMYGCKMADNVDRPTAYTYNGPGCAKSLADLDALSREHVLNWGFQKNLAPGDNEGERAFSNGNVAMLLSGTWEAPSIVADSEGAFGFDAAPLPVEPGSYIQHAASGYGMYANTKNPEWAWEYIKYLAGPDGQIADAKQGLGQPAIPAILESVYCAAEVPPANRCEIAKRGTTADVWEPATANWSAGFWDIIAPGFEAGFGAKTAPDWQKILDDLVAQSQQAAPLP